MEPLTRDTTPLIQGDPIYTVPVVAKYLGLAASNLYAQCRRREFPHIHIGESTVRIRHSQLVKFLADSARGDPH